VSELPAFRRLELSGCVLVVDVQLQEEVSQLDLVALAGTGRAAGPIEPGHGGRAPTRIVPLPHHSTRLHLRPVRHGGWLAALWGGRVLGLSRPIAELETTALLRSRGAPVPRPVMVLGRRQGGLWSATLATTHEEGAVDGERFIRAAPTRRRLIQAARAAGRAVRGFHDAGGRHADLHIRNLLFREEPSTIAVVVVDLDRGRVRSNLSPARRMTELMRLYRSLEKHELLHGDRSRVSAAFFGAYLDRNRQLRRAMLSRRGREGLRLALHRLGYRLHSAAAPESTRGAESG
jgi:tRNA A-37 threonylcarbamoyl transferase component Bud32